MASISTDKNGNRRILFTGPNRSRRIIYLGGVPMATARTVKGHVENLAAALLHGHSPAVETSEWVGRRDDTLYNKLVAVGLVPARESTATERSAVTLDGFLNQYIRGRTDIKPNTHRNLEQARRNLVDHFGASRPLGAITPGQADEFRIAMLAKLGENTVRRHCGRARQFFRAAVRRKLIAENPFADMKGCAVKANTERFYFVSREEADKVLAACPDAQWRLLFALSRYGGLRCPSEHLALTWADVHWDHSRFTIRSSKTEHHADGGVRQTPMFPELRVALEEVFNEAETALGRPPAGSEFVITRYRHKNANLRTQFQRIIRSAGLTPWPKLFQNLRSTRETELAERFPIHKVCRWLGNTQAVAAKHYLQLRDEDFDQASRDANSDAHPTQKTTQQPTGDLGKRWQEATQAPDNQGLLRAYARDFKNNPKGGVPRRGLEPLTTGLEGRCSIRLS